MKRFALALTLILPFALAVSVSAASLKWEVTVRTDSRYKLLVFTGTAPDKPLPRDLIIQVVEELNAKEPTGNLQIAVYDVGKKFGDGLRAYGSKFGPPTN